MKTAVFGLWHLGCVTAACLAESGCETIGIHPDADVIAGLQRGKAPLSEPGLDDLIAAQTAKGSLSFSSDPASVSAVDLVWVTFDTPVDDEDRADVAFVTSQVEGLFPHLAPGSTVLISSQVPVGTTTALAKRFHELTGRDDVAFAYSPENLRLGRALAAFRDAESRIIGTVDGEPSATIEAAFSNLNAPLLWMTRESAEMVKHALNSYLALCVTYANEIAAVCERVGADARDVERAIRTDPRIGARAYVRAGSAFAGGTLARDVTFLKQLASELDVPISLIPEILTSNRQNQTWPLRQLQRHLGSLKGRVVAILGLAYTPGTSTSRRSAMLELATSIAEAGGQARIYDVLISSLPAAPDGVTVCDSLKAALDGASAVVIGQIDASQYNVTPELLRSAMERSLIIDQDRLLAAMASVPSLEYVTFGRPS